MQKILVTGGAGFIGRHMVLSLLNQGFVVRVLDSAPLDFTHENLTIIHGDVRTQDILSSAVAECSAVIHLAGVLGYSDYQINYDVHVDGTKNLITACQKQEVKRIIAYSTFAATRENPAAYGATKKQMEDLLLQSTLNVTIFRPTMVLGDRSKGLTTIIKQSKSYPLFVPMIGSGKATRQPVSVSDIVKLTISTLDNTSSYGKAYNIAGNETIKFKDLVKTINQHLNINKRLIPIPTPVAKLMALGMDKVMKKPPFSPENVRNLTLDTTVDITPAKQDLHFQPTPLATTLAEVMQNFK